MLVKLQNNFPEQWPVSEMSVRLSCPNISLPQKLTPDILQEFGYGIFSYSNKPEFNALTQKVEERTPAKQDDIWVQQWEVVELYSEAERAQVLAQDEADKLEAEKANVRAERNGKLSDSDWTQVADAPVDKAAWAVYRQALRDVTTQQGFPWTIDWPTMP